MAHKDFVWNFSLASYADTSIQVTSKRGTTPGDTLSVGQHSFLKGLLPECTKPLPDPTL